MRYNRKICRLASAQRHSNTDVAIKFTTSVARERGTVAPFLRALPSVLCFQLVYGTWIQSLPDMNWRNDKLASPRDWLIPSIWYFQSSVRYRRYVVPAPTVRADLWVSWATFKNLCVKLNQILWMMVALFFDVDEQDL
jgi:hypothetical protein